VQHELRKEGEECFNIEEFNQKVQTAVELLPQKCRKIFNLSKKEKFTYKQIAEQLDISVKTVEAQMGIALRKIRKHLSASYPQIRNTLFLFLYKTKFLGQ